VFDSGGAIQFDKSDKALEFGDNYKAVFGAGGDLKIFHDGTKSKIADTSGTGPIVIASNELQIRNAADGEDLAKFTQNGAVELYHNNSKKFTTTDSGAAVTGRLLIGASAQPNPSNAEHAFGSWTAANASDAHIDALIDGSTFGALYETRNSGHLVIGLQNNDVNDGVSIISSDSNFNTNSLYTNHVISFKADGDVEIDSDGAIMYDKSDKALKFGDNYKATFGNSGDLDIYHDGSNSYVQDDGTGELRILSSFARIRSVSGTTSATFYPTNSVDLYYNTTKRFETTDSGAKVTGQIVADSATVTNLNYQLISQGVASNSYDKIRLWETAPYSLGMVNGNTFGGLDDYAITFTMSNNDNRGFLFRDNGHTTAQGAMAITTDGELTVAKAARIGDVVSLIP
jgi:hypothetical protein